MIGSKRTWCFVFALLGSAVCAAQPTVLAQKAAESDHAPISREIALVDTSGQRHTLSGQTAPRLTVLVFLGTECPVSNGYAPALKRLEETQRANRVSILGIHCDPDVTAKVAQAHAAEYQLPFPLVLDHEQRIAGICNVGVVPTAVVVDAAGWILYRGRIDNRYVASGVRRPEATVFDLQAAIDAALAGKRPPVAVTEPFGCPLPPPKRN